MKLVQPVWVFLSVFFSSMTVGMFVVFLPFILMAQHFSPIDLGLSLSIFALCNTISAIFWGRLSDIIQRKQLISILLLGQLLIFFLIFLFSSQLYVLWFLMGLLGIFSGVLAVFRALVLDLYAHKNNYKILGFVGMSVGLGFAMGPILGTVFSAVLPNFIHVLPLLTMGTAGISLVFLLMTSRTSSEINAKQMHIAYGTLLTHTRFLYILGFNFLLSMIFSGFEATFALWAHHTWQANATFTGILLSVMVVVYALTQGVLVPYLVKKINPYKVIALAFLFVGLAFIVFAYAHYIVFLLGGLVLLGIGVGLSIPTFQGLVVALFPEENKGTTLGIFQGTTSLGRVLAPALFTFLLYISGAHITYVTLGIVGFVSFVLYGLTVKMFFNKQ